MIYFNRYLKSDFKRALGTRFLIAIALFIILRYYTIHDEFLISIKDPNYSIMSLLHFLFNDMLLGVLSAFTLIPFGEAYINEKRNGFLLYFILKGDNESYILSKLLTLIITSFLVGIFSYLIIIGYISLYLPIGRSGVMVNNNPFIIYTLKISNPWRLVVYLIIIRSLYLCLLGISAFTINLYVRNKLLLFMGPSLIYALSTRVGFFINKVTGFPTLKLMSTGYIHSNNAHSAFAFIILVFLIAICFCLLISYVKMQEELRYE